MREQNCGSVYLQFIVSGLLLSYNPCVCVQLSVNWLAESQRAFITAARLENKMTVSVTIS